MTDIFNLPTPNSAQQAAELVKKREQINAELHKPIIQLDNIQNELRAANKCIDNLSHLLQQECEARIEAQKANDLENKRANRLSVWALVVAIIALGCTIISAIFDVLSFFTR